MKHSVVNANSAVSATFELARAIEAKDPYTAGHTWRVANYGQILAAALDYPPDKIEAMIFAGTLHDIGKLMVPDEILTKPGRLTDEEFEIMKGHPQEGFELLKSNPQFSGVLNVVQMHHEAYDGSGYPFGLAGSEIPREARLFAVVDAFDAMTTDRCYRPALGVENAVYELWRNRGQQFDPPIVSAFLQLEHDGLLEHIIGYGDFGVKIGKCPRCGPVLELHNGHRLDSEVVCKVCNSRFMIAAIENGEFHLRYVGRVAEDPPQIGSGEA